MDENNLPDEEGLIIQLIRPLLPGATVLCAPDVDDQAETPLIVLSMGPGTDRDETDPDGYDEYTYPANFQIIAGSRTETRALALQLHQAMLSFRHGGAQIEGLGIITGVETSMLPMRTVSSEIGGANVTVYIAGYGVDISPS